MFMPLLVFRALAVVVSYDQQLSVGDKYCLVVVVFADTLRECLWNSHAYVMKRYKPSPRGWACYFL
jgi:hypothetical protein